MQFFSLSARYALKVYLCVYIVPRLTLIFSYRSARFFFPIPSFLPLHVSMSQRNKETFKQKQKNKMGPVIAAFLVFVAFNTL